VKGETTIRPLRVYADTSVFGGTFDKIFAEASKAFFEQVHNARFRLVISELVEKELRQSPKAVQRIFEEFLPDMEVIVQADPALLLQQAYLDAGVVKPKWANDALHLALASVSECTEIVSWNFRHIVNLKCIPLYNAVNMSRGYGPIAIHTPQEVLFDENAQEDL